MHRIPGGYAMQPKTQITSRWKDAAAVERYQTGVSLHSHTSCSEETLKFVHMFCRDAAGGAGSCCGGMRRPAAKSTG